MRKKFLTAVLCTLMLFSTAVFAADFKIGDTIGTVTCSYSIPVTETARACGSKIMLEKGNTLETLRACEIRS